ATSTEQVRSVGEEGRRRRRPFSFLDLMTWARDDPAVQSMEAAMSLEITPQQADINNKNITQLIYALYAASLIFPVTWVAAIILNDVKRDDVANSFYESHFRWQIRTFWFSLLWAVVGGILVFAFGLGFLILGASYIWVIYRIVKGWLRLTEAKAMYV